jgi:hypothetical protein
MKKDCPFQGSDVVFHYRREIKFVRKNNGEVS